MTIFSRRQQVHREGKTGNIRVISLKFSKGIGVLDSHVSSAALVISAHTKSIRKSNKYILIQRRLNHHVEFTCIKLCIYRVTYSCWSSAKQNFGVWDLMHTSNSPCLEQQLHVSSPSQIKVLVTCDQFSNNLSVICKNPYFILPTWPISELTWIIHFSFLLFLLILCWSTMDKASRKLSLHGM